MGRVRVACRRWQIEGDDDDEEDDEEEDDDV